MGKNNVKISISADTASAKQQINNFSKELNQSKRSVRDLTAAYERLDDATKSSSIGKNMKKDLDSAISKFNELKKIQDKIKSNLGDVKIDTSGFKMPDIGSLVSKSLDSAGFSGASSMIETLGGVMGGSLTAGAVAATAGVAAAGIAVKEFVDVSQQAVQKSSEFGQALSQLSAITGVQGTALDNMRSQIQDLGKETNSSVVDVTNGMAKIGGAMPALLDDVEGLGEMYKNSSTLAKAGLMSQDDAVQSLTTIMAQFNHTVADSGKDIDILANASQAGSAEIGDLAGTMKVAGVAANSAGLSLQEASAMAEVLGDNALKGSEAGTQLRNIFSKFSAEGIKDADTMMQTLAAHAGDTGWMVKQFGVDSANAAQMLAAGGDRYKELLSSLDATGTATEMAATNFNNLAGDIDRMKVQWENFLSSFNVDAADGPVRELTQSIGELMQSVIDLVGEFQNSTTIQSAMNVVGQSGSMLIDILTTVVNIVGDVLGVFFDLVDTSGTTSTALDLLAGAFEMVREAIKMVEGLIFAVRYAINWLLKQVIDFKNYIMTKVSKIPLFETISKYIDWVQKKVQVLINWWKDLKDTIADTRAAMNEASVTEGNKEKGQKSNNKGKSYNQQTSEAINYAKGKAGGGKTQEDKQKIYIKTLQNGIDFERKRLALAKTDYQKKQIQNRIKSYEDAKKNSPFKSSSETVTPPTSKSPKPSKTNNNDQISQANKSYIETMIELNSSLKDSMITQKDYDEKKKSAIESLIDSYHKQGKTVDVSPELSALKDKLGEVKESIRVDKIKEAEDDYAKGLNLINKQYTKNLISAEEAESAELSALNKIVSNYLEIGNLTDEEKKNLTTYIAKIKEIQKSNLQKSLNEDVSDIGKKDTSIADKFNLGDKKSNKEQFDDLVKQFDELTAKRNEKKKEAVKLGVDLDFSDLDKQQAELSSKIANMAKKVKKEANFDTALDTFSSLGNIASNIDSIGTAFENVKNPLQGFAAMMQTITTLMQTYKTITELVTGAQNLFAASTTAAATADTAATNVELANSAAKTAAAGHEALAKAAKSGAGIGFPANIAAIAAGVAAVIAALSAFATGGIVGGSGASTTIGDNTLIRVNRGEMVLNNRQQARLFKMLDGGLSLNTTSAGGTVDFRISGSNLYGSLKNYSSMSKKHGKITGIS